MTIINALLAMRRDRQLATCLYVIRAYESHCMDEIRHAYREDPQSPRYKMALNLHTLVLQPPEVLDMMREETQHALVLEHVVFLRRANARATRDAHSQKS